MSVQRCEHNTVLGTAEFVVGEEVVPLRIGGPDGGPAPTEVLRGGTVTLRASVPPRAGTPRWLPGPGAKVTIEPSEGTTVTVRGLEVSATPADSVVICVVTRDGVDLFAEHALTVLSVDVIGETPGGPLPTATFLGGAVRFQAWVVPPMSATHEWTLDQAAENASLLADGANVWVRGLQEGPTVLVHRFASQVPGGATQRRTVPLSVRPRLELSGPDWCDRFDDPKRWEFLEPPFRQNVWDFFEAIRDAVAPGEPWRPTTWTQLGGEVRTLPGPHELTIRITATKRPRPRAHLMHHAYAVAREAMPPFVANERSWAGFMGEGDAIEPISIDWDHGTIDGSIRAADDMVRAYHIDHQASLTSNHFKGHALDMMITWRGSFQMGRKQTQSTAEEPSPGETLECVGDSVTCLALHAIGASYGVVKFIERPGGKPDPPHWSLTGG